MKGRLTIPCLAASLTLMACAPTLQSMTRNAGEGRAPYLVEILDEPNDRATSQVSVSVVTVSTLGPMTKRPNADALAEMRAIAAAAGANFLLIERVDTRWRRAFYGSGLRLSASEETPLTTCQTNTYADTLRTVSKRAGRCLSALSASRKGLSGLVEFTFEVDTFGRVKRALPGRGSTRDSQMQRCLLKPIMRADFGPHDRFRCEGAIRMELQ
jgi:hypothetical protein